MCIEFAGIVLIGWWDNSCMGIANLQVLASYTAIMIASLRRESCNLGPASAHTKLNHKRVRWRSISLRHAESSPKPEDPSLLPGRRISYVVSEPMYIADPSTVVRIENSKLLRWLACRKFIINRHKRIVSKLYVHTNHVSSLLWGRCRCDTNGVMKAFPFPRTSKEGCKGYQ